MGCLRTHIHMFVVMGFFSCTVMGSLGWAGNFQDPNAGLKIDGNAGGTKLEGPIFVELRRIVDNNADVAEEGGQAVVRLRQGNDLATFVTSLEGPVGVSPTGIQKLVINSIGPAVIKAFFVKDPDLDPLNGICWVSEDDPALTDCPAGGGLIIKLKSASQASSVDVKTGEEVVVVGDPDTVPPTPGDPPDELVDVNTRHFVLDVVFAVN